MKIHSHTTRQTQNAVYFKPRVKKSIGNEQIVYRGAKLWKNVDGSIQHLNCKILHGGDAFAALTNFRKSLMEMMYFRRWNWMKTKNKKKVFAGI